MATAESAAQRITVKLPALYPKQKAAFFCNERYSICEASTKAGKTAACIVWLISQGFQGREGQNFWWVAPTFTVAKMAFRRMKRAIPVDYYGKNESELYIRLKTGGTIWFKSADKPDSLYGEDVYAAVIDEASRCKEESWHAVRSTLTKTKAPIRIIGNVKGRKNWYYNLARLAQSGAADMHYTKLTAYDAAEAGVLDIAEIEDAKKVLPDAVFRELYLAEPSDDGGNPFGIKFIDAARREGLAPGPVVCYGIDLAKSSDYTWIIGLNKRGEVCFSERFQRDWGWTTERIIQVVGNTPALIDSTGVGDPIVENVQKKCRNVEGFKFTSQSKQQLMEGLASAFQQGKLTYSGEDLYNELIVYEYVYTRTGVRYSAPEGLHDDGVCALALAWNKARITPEPVKWSAFDDVSVKDGPGW